jgi:heme-degrading monooxygenase HmoA
MYARVTTPQIPPESVEAALRYLRDEAVTTLRYLRDEAVATLRAQPGFRGLYFLVGHGSGKGVSITLWETEESLRASEAAYVGQAGAELIQQMGLSIPSVEIYEVVVQTPAGGGAPDSPARFARVITSQLPPEQGEPGPRAIREQGSPTAVYELPGFRRAYFLADRPASRIMNVSLWESEGVLRAGDEAAARVAPQAAQQYGVTSALQYETFEVAVQV